MTIETKSIVYLADGCEERILAAREVLSYLRKTITICWLATIHFCVALTIAYPGDTIPTFENMITR